MKKLALSLFLICSALFGAASESAAAVPTCRGMPATIVGTAGDDHLFGTAGDDVIVGFAGDDTIDGNGGDDTICGGHGNDLIYGYTGDDEIAGGPGSDTIIGGPDSDDLRGGPGRDLIYGDASDSDDLDGAGDVIRGGDHADTIWARAGDDIVFGGAGPDAIYGGLGDDLLRGTAGDDTLVGGPDSDTAIGNRGFDECSAESADCERVVPDVAAWNVANDQGFLTITATIEHGEPVDHVDVALKAGGQNLWVQLDGTMGPHKVWHPMVMTSAPGFDTEWTGHLTTGRGYYSMSLRAVDAGGDVGRLRPRPWFEIFVTGIEMGLIITGDPVDFHEMLILPPNTAIGRSPRNQWGNPVPASGTGDTVRLSGARFGGSYYVDAAIRSDATGLWLQADGSFGSTMVRYLADCNFCDETSKAFWFFDAELADGTYEFYGFAYTDGPSESEIVWPFRVDGSIDETPHIAVDQPAGVTFTDGHVHLSGTATDNVGVHWVKYSIRDRDTGLWLSSWQSNEWGSEQESFRAELSSPNEPTTDWWLDIELPPGRYNLSARALDGALRRGSVTPWFHFEVAE